MGFEFELGFFGKAFLASFHLQLKEVRELINALGKLLAQKLEVLWVELYDDALAVLNTRAIKTMLRALEAIRVVNALLLGPVARTVLLPVIVGALEPTGLEAEHFGLHVQEFGQHAHFIEPGHVCEGLRAGPVHECAPLHTVMVHIDKGQDVLSVVTDQFFDRGDLW